MPRVLATGLAAAGLLWFAAASQPDATATAAQSRKAPSPAIHAVAPLKTAAVGQELTIRGRNFLRGSRRNTVYFKAPTGAPVAIKARHATPTTITVVVPRGVTRRMIARGGVARPTRFRLRIRSGRLAGRYTPKRLSPTIAPPASSAAGGEERQCPAAGCDTPRETISAAAAPAAPPAAGSLVFEDHFDGPAVDKTAWSPYTSAGHAGNGLRRPSAFTQENGQLVITATWDGTNIVTGGMSHRLNQLYGSYEFRARVDPDPSGQLSGVVLTWPQSGRWVPDGEMDMWETGHSAAGRNPWHSFIHRSQDGKVDSQIGLPHYSDAAQWHTVRMDWTPGAIRIYVDGVLDGQVTDPARIPNTPHHVAVQLDAFSNRPLHAPVRMYVDWLRVYR